MKRIVCVYNPSSGSSLSKAELQELLGNDGVQVQCVNIAAAEHVVPDANANVLVAAGGDGTVNATAQLAVALHLPLGVIPAGTLNHFAKDVGLPADSAKAASVIRTGTTKLIDYCTVNDRVFLNNSSLGVYPSTVLSRDKQDAVLGKWPSAVVAFVAALFRNPRVYATLAFAHKQLPVKSPLIFIGNNSYHLEKVGFTNRSSLTSGKLYVYAVKAARSTTLMRLALLSVLGMRAHKDDILREVTGPVRITSSHQHVQVALDGEVRKLAYPLEYTMHHKALKVFVPAAN